MTRQAFLARLRDGLRGLPPRAVSDIVADYEAHFAEGEAHGRSEAEVAAALGEPWRARHSHDRRDVPPARRTDRQGAAHPT